VTAAVLLRFAPLPMLSISLRCPQATLYSPTNRHLNAFYRATQDIQTTVALYYISLKKCMHLQETQIYFNTKTANCIMLSNNVCTGDWTEIYL